MAPQSTRPTSTILTATLLLATAATSANAFFFSLTPVTTTTPNFAGTILIQGTVTVAPGEIFFSPNAMSTVHLPFKSGFTAGFNGSGQTFDPTFLAWNGIGTYTGPIYQHLISTNNLGYSSGMPTGLYNFNPLGPGGQSAIILNYAGTSGSTQSATSTYAIDVIPVPTPSAAAALTLTSLLTLRRRR